MGIFDVFSRNEKDTALSNEANKLEHEYSESFQKKNTPLQIRRPHSFLDVEEIIDNLKQRRPVIVYFNELKEETAKRVLDLLSGAIYALGGGLCELERDMYIFTPDGVNEK